MNLSAAEKALANLERNLPKALRQGLEEAARAGVARARQLSSGTASKAQLAAEDYPYAKRHVQPLRDPEIINAQTGAFRDRWSIETQGRGMEKGPKIVNRDPVADYLRFGTSVMHRRPIDAAIERFLAEEAPSYITRELSRMRLL